FIQSLRFQRSFMIGQHAVRIQKCGEKVNLLNKVDHTIGIVLCRCVDLLLGALDIGIHASHTVFCAASLLREKAHAMKIDDRREEPTRFLIYEIAEMMASLIEKLNNKTVEVDDEIEFLEVVTKEKNIKNSKNNDNNKNMGTHEDARKEIIEDGSFDPDLCLKMEDFNSTPYYEEEEVEAESTHYASSSTLKEPIHSTQNTPILSSILATNLTSPTSAKAHSNTTQPSHTNVSDTFITSTNAKLVYQLPFANAIECALNPQASDTLTYGTTSSMDTQENKANNRDSTPSLAKGRVNNFTTTLLTNGHDQPHHNNKMIAEMLSMMHNAKSTIINDNNSNNTHQQFHKSNEHMENIDFVQQSTLNDDADIPSSFDGPQTGLIRKNKCAICGRCFSAASHLKDHMAIHTGDRPVKCTLCYGNFINTSKLKRHMRDRHRMGEFKCNTCDRVFKRKMDLKMHNGTKGCCVKELLRPLPVPEQYQPIPASPIQLLEPNIQLSGSLHFPRTFNHS
ncbi:hypothetical protein PRIPAC_79047, partial [Pristionchus pacificus]|uniref:Zinc finger protein n=1 Tax=Pristionchus pacificus TaxID=54126 RepID=A0A2A6BX84_PRIPA